MFRLWVGMGFFWGGMILSRNFPLLGLLFIPAIVFDILAIGPALKVSRLYKEYKSQFQPPKQ